MKTLSTKAVLLAAIIIAVGSPAVSHAQDSLSFANWSLESGTDLTQGAVYRFDDVKTGVDALVRLDSLRGGATLIQIDDASPSTPVLSPRVNGIPSSSPEPQADLSITFVLADTSTPIALDSVDVASVDIDGNATRMEFTELSGFDSYQLEANPPTLLTVTPTESGLRFTAADQDFGGSSPDTTEAAVVASYTGVSQIEVSLGQTGTDTAAGTRVSALYFVPGIVPYADPDTTFAPDANIGTAMQVGSPSANGGGSFNIPIVVTIVGYGTTSLYDLVLTSDLSVLGTYTAGAPSEGEYTVDNPVVASTSGGAIIAGASANTGYDGATDQRILLIASGNVLPAGGSATISFNITWYPSAGVDQATIHAFGRGDHAEDGTSAGETVDQSHTGTDPDPDSDGPGNNFDGSLINVSGLPVELASLTAIANGADLDLRWRTLSETNVAGFAIEARAQIDETFSELAYLASSGDGYTPTDYAYTATSVEAGTYEIRLKIIDNDGSFSYSPTVVAVVDFEHQLSIETPFPNPARERTSIPFHVDQSQSITIRVFDLTGRQLQTVVNGPFQPGRHAVILDAGALPAGMYIVRMDAERGSQSKPLTIVN